MRGTPWGEFAGRYGDSGRPLFLWELRQRCGVTLREEVEAAGGMKPAAVDATLKRLPQRARRDRKIRARQTELLRRLSGTA